MTVPSVPNKPKRARRGGKASGYIVALTTCASRREADRIAGAVVERRLAACVNIGTAPVSSVYRWKDKIEQAAEFLLLIKTSRAKLPALRAEIERLHSYDVPEFLALSVDSDSSAYLAWLDDCLRGA